MSPDPYSLSGDSYGWPTGTSISPRQIWGLGIATRAECGGVMAVLPEEKIWTCEFCGARHWLEDKLLSCTKCGAPGGV